VGTPRVPKQKTKELRREPQTVLLNSSGILGGKRVLGGGESSKQKNVASHIARENSVEREAEQRERPSTPIRTVSEREKVLDAIKS